MKDKNTKNEQFNNERTDGNSTSGASPKQKKKKRAARIAFVTIVHALGVGAIVGLSVALYFSQDKIEMQASYQREMESVYARSYYNLVDGANDLDVTMAKFAAASTPEKQQALLYEIWSAATLAEDNLSSFDGSDEGVKTATRFVNQLGDYSLYLARKLSDGEELTAAERETFFKLKPMAKVLKDALSTVQTDIDAGKLFLDEGGMLETFSSAFSEFTEPSLDYPEMIYDGPFSDALETREAKALAADSEITPETGAEKLTKLFPTAANVQYIGRCEGRIPTYNYSFDVDGASAYIQLSVKGGKVINYNVASDNSDESAELADAGQAAIEFACNVGYEDMQVVWSATANGRCFVNLAPVQDGIILYPDLIKVKLEGGKVTGMDSSHHAYNHVRRTLPSPVLNEEDARRCITLEGVREGRLALIPQDETKETLCYEFECEADGTYFVYIDALTGREAEILYVVESDLGTTLM